MCLNHSIRKLNSDEKLILEIEKLPWLQSICLSHEKISELSLIFCYSPDLRKIFSRMVKLEDTVNLTFVRWCLKVSARALCSLGEIFKKYMFLKYLPSFLVLADAGSNFQMENVTSFVDNLAWAFREWWLQSESVSYLWIKYMFIKY